MKSLDEIVEYFQRQTSSTVYPFVWQRGGAKQIRTINMSFICIYSKYAVDFSHIYKSDSSDKLMILLTLFGNMTTEVGHYSTNFVLTDEEKLEYQLLYFS